MDPSGGLDFGDGFTVDANGILHAKGAEIEGKITSGEGEIGGWTINEDSISAGNLTLNSNGSINVGALTLKGDGFYNGATPAVTDAIIAWTGWTQGLFNRLEFVNGILVSMSGGGGSGGV